MKFFAQLITFFLLLVAIGIKAAKDGLKNFNFAVTMDIFARARLIFQDFRQKWTEFKNEWKTIDYQEVSKEVKTNFQFLEDRDLEYLLEDATDIILVFPNTIMKVVSVIARFKAYFSTEDIANSPKLEK